MRILAVESPRGIRAHNYAAPFGYEAHGCEARRRYENQRFLTICERRVIEVAIEQNVVREARMSKMQQQVGKCAVSTDDVSGIALDLTGGRLY